MKKAHNYWAFVVFLLSPVTVFILLSGSTWTVFSSIYSIYYIIITIVISLFTRLITVFIYGIIGTISIIFFCDLQTNYKHCLQLLFQPTFIIFYLINFFSKQYGTTLCFKVFDKISSPFFDWYHKNFSISTDVVNSPLRIPLYWKT